MNTDIVSGKLDEIKGSIQTECGKRTGDDLAAWKGRRDALLGKLEQRYGKAKETFEDKVDELLAKI
ncbi:MAG: hypothetical protein ACI9U2_002965, partial [Bradymonadia bacterium]